MHMAVFWAVAPCEPIKIEPTRQPSFALIAVRTLDHIFMPYLTS
jgi:hypothetical protein